MISTKLVIIYSKQDTKLLSDTTTSKLIQASILLFWRTNHTPLPARPSPTKSANWTSAELCWTYPPVSSLLQPVAAISLVLLQSLALLTPASLFAKIKSPLASLGDYTFNPPCQFPQLWIWIKAIRLTRCWQVAPFSTTKTARHCSLACYWSKVLDMYLQFTYCFHRPLLLLTWTFFYFFLHVHIEHCKGFLLFICLTLWHCKFCNYFAPGPCYISFKIVDT